MLDNLPNLSPMMILELDGNDEVWVMWLQRRDMPSTRYHLALYPGRLTVTNIMRWVVMAIYGFWSLLIGA